MKRLKKEFAEKLTKLFPDKEQSLKNHYRDYRELLGHIFFADEVCAPLFEMLHLNKSDEQIKKYCSFVEDMWLNGSDDVANVVDVTILERLSDNETVWKNLGKNISNQFIDYINTELLVKNAMMRYVKSLEYNI